MKTIEELREKESEIISKISPDRYGVAQLTERMSVCMEYLAAVRAEIAALSAFNPPNRITHSDQLCVGMRVSMGYKAEAAERCFGTVIAVSSTHLIYFADSSHSQQDWTLDGLNVVAPGKTAIPLGDRDAWVERVEECPVLACPFIGVKPPHCCVFPPARCPHA